MSSKIRTSTIFAMAANMTFIASFFAGEMALPMLFITAYAGLAGLTFATLGD
jgi:hypothetical protein